MRFVNAIPLLIRELLETDCPTMSAAFAAQGWNKPTQQFEQYFRESQTGERVVLVAEVAGEFAGYVTIVWDSGYPPFRAGNIPEVVDFNVLIKYQRQGIGSALMDEAERRIGQRSEVAGIGVGLFHDYGNAQILYAQRGYIPDGRGIFSQGQWLKYGDQISVDDSLTLYLTKKLTQTQASDAYAHQTEIIRQTFSQFGHSLDHLLEQMRKSGQSALYLAGARLDHDYGFVSGDVGMLLSVLPEDARKAAVPGYHPGSAETYFPFQGTLVMEFLEAGQVQEKQLTPYVVHTLPPGQCHRVRFNAHQQAASLIVKTNLHHKPGVVRCHDCEYYPDSMNCPLFHRWNLEQI